MNNDAFSLRFTAPKMNADGDEAEVMLYGEIISGMPENWKWDKEDKSAADFDRAIKEAVRSGARKLLLRINSPGGILREAVAMRSTLNTAGFETVTIRIEGLCASAATVVATLPGAHVQIAEGSEFMVHNPVCGCYGYADDMEATAAYLRKSEEIARGFYTKRTGADEATVKAWMDAETWFTAREALEAGFCDEVISEGGQEPEIAMNTRTLAAMRAMYAHMPERLQALEKTGSSKTTAVAAAVLTEDKQLNRSKEEHNMEIKDLTAAQLASENPQLMASIRETAMQAERERMQDIDDLTTPGYEQMAAEAKKSGMSAMDFHKAVVKAQREKGAQFMQSRKGRSARAPAFWAERATGTKKNRPKWPLTPKKWPPTRRERAAARACTERKEQPA